MAKFECPGVQEYIRQIEALKKDSTGFIKRAVYEGGGVVAKAIADAIDALPSGSSAYVANGGVIKGITDIQREGLRDGLGLAKMTNENGYINTKVGFDGYNGYITRKYPNGQPNALIARALESGTSQRPKTRFVSKAVKACREEAAKAMADRLDDDIKKAMED